MATLGEIEAALGVLEQAGTPRERITVLHCNTEYPTPVADVNLRAMGTIGRAFGVEVGYSDHTQGIEIPIAAAALGAAVVEKHFTLDRSLPGPDHKASLEPAELKAMVLAIRNIEKALGDGIKRPSPSEEQNKASARSSLLPAPGSRFGEALNQLGPDLMLVLGDRFEIFSAVAAAMVARIPVAHLHGGETTEGAFDEAIRHSITKMSHLHFVATKEYRKRVIQLGELPDRVFVVGGLGIDNIRRLSLLDRAGLEAALGFKLRPKNLLVTFHPATLESTGAVEQFSELLAALDTLEDTGLIFTMPNADTDGRALAKMIGEFVASRPNARAYTSLGQLNYLSCVRHVDGVLGNSS